MKEEYICPNCALRLIGNVRQWCCSCQKNVTPVDSESHYSTSLPWKRFGETPPKDGAPLSVPVIDDDNEFIVSGYFVQPNIVKSALLGTVYVGSDDQYLLDTDLLATVPR